MSKILQKINTWLIKELSLLMIYRLCHRKELETSAVLKKLTVAARNLGELNGLFETLPDPKLFTNTIVLQESKNSSAIENIVTTQDELYKAMLEEATEQNYAAKEVLG